MGKLQRAWSPLPDARGRTRDARLRQVLVDTLADPEASQGYEGFRTAFERAAVRNGVPPAVVTEAFAQQGWGPVPDGTCSARGRGPGGPDRGDPGGTGGASGAGLGGGGAPAGLGITSGGC